MANRVPKGKAFEAQQNQIYMNNTIWFDVRAQE